MTRKKIEIYSNIFSQLTEAQIAKSEDLEKQGQIMKCPFCTHRRAKFLSKLVNDMLRRLETPKTIYQTVAENGVILLDPRNDKQMSLEVFTKAIGSHVTLCRKENFREYIELVENKENNIESEFHQFVEKIKQEDSHIIKEPTLITPRNKGELKLNMGDALPEMINNQLLIVLKQQREYLNGEIDTPPDLKAITQILHNLKTLIGSHELTDII